MTRFITGDAITAMRLFEAESVQCVVTSIPYWGLRDYGIPPVVWGGNGECEHEWVAVAASPDKAARRQIPHGDGRIHDGYAEDRVLISSTGVATGNLFCRCGAWLGCLGLEPTPAMYVEHVVTVFREVRRILKPDGVLFLNVGDSYCSQPGNGRGGGSNLDGGNPHLSGNQSPRSSRAQGKIREVAPGFKPKDRCMIPARVAIALQDDGWWLRDEIVWAKPNPLPSSVTDRTTPAHEMIYLLTKAKRYFYNQDAIRTPFAETSISRLTQPNIETQAGALGPMAEPRLTAT